MRRRGEAENTEGDVIPNRRGVTGTLSAALEMAGPDSDRRLGVTEKRKSL